MLIPIQILYSLIFVNCAEAELCVTLFLDTCALYTYTHKHTHTHIQTNTNTHVQYVRSLHHVRTYSAYPLTGLSLTVRPATSRRQSAAVRQTTKSCCFYFSFSEHFVTVLHFIDLVFSAPGKSGSLVPCLLDQFIFLKIWCLTTKYSCIIDSNKTGSIFDHLKNSNIVILQ